MENYDTEGNLFITGQNNKEGEKVYRQIFKGDNDNSLGIFLIQGDKKAFFGGDMNNNPENVNGEIIGDEDRLKYEIGKIDLLKLGHHGYYYSNTKDYMDILLPDYTIITNDTWAPYLKTLSILEEKKINYLFSTEDEYEVCASIYNDEITLGFGTPGVKKLSMKCFIYLKIKFI